MLAFFYYQLQQCIIIIMGVLAQMVNSVKTAVLILRIIQLIGISIMTIFYVMLFNSVEQCRTISLFLAFGCTIVSISALVYIVKYKDGLSENAPCIPNSFVAIVVFFGSYTILSVVLCIFVFMNNNNACLVNMGISNYKYLVLTAVRHC